MHLVKDNVTAKRAERCLDFIGILDRRYEKPQEMIASELIDIFSRDGIRRYRSAYSILSQHGVIPLFSQHELDDCAERVKQQSLINEVGDLWSRPVIDRYHAYLMEIYTRHLRWRRGKKQKFIGATITMYIRAAKQLLLWLPNSTHDIRGLDQTTVDLFIREHRGQALNLRRFIRYLNSNEKLFVKLAAGYAPPMSQTFYLLGEDTYRRLLRTWVNTDDDNLRISLIGLFMLLYCQSLKKTSEMRLDQITHDAKRKVYRVKFGKIPVELDPRVAQVLERWLDSRRALSSFDTTDENPYLFPGRRPGSHITTSGISYYLRTTGVSVHELFATAVYKNFANGISSPKTLANSFGITRGTAMGYWWESNPSLRDDINRMRELEDDAAA